MRNAAKFSAAKVTYPGRKQVYRSSRRRRDTMRATSLLSKAKPRRAKPLLVPVMRAGRRIAPTEPLTECATALPLANRAPARALRELEPAAPPYPVRHSARLEALLEQVRERVARRSVAHRRNGHGFPPRHLLGCGYAGGFHAAGRKALRARRGKVASESQAPHRCRPPRRGLSGVGRLRARAGRSRFSASRRIALRGTPGAAIVPETLAGNSSSFPIAREPDSRGIFASSQQVILEKQTLDVFDNPNTEKVIERLKSFTDADAEFVVFGVVTEYCVRCAAKGLLERGRRVSLVADAIATLKAEDGDKALAELSGMGAHMITADEALALVQESSVR